MHLLKTLSMAGLFGLAACAQEAPSSSVPAPDEPDLAADTASLPDTDIFLAKFSISDELPKLENFRNITNNSGYDNQPAFLPGADALYFVSEGVGGKTDIWQYDIGTDQKVRIFESPEISEYSPQAAPMAYGISYIQENEAGDVTRVHAASTDGAPGEAVISLAPLGYYAWLQGGMKLAVYMRSEPAALQLVDVATGDVEVIAENIGRSLKATSDGGGLYFTKITEAEKHDVVFFDLSDHSLTRITALPELSQDFAISFSSSGEAKGMFAASGSTLSFLDLTQEPTQWRAVADLSDEGMVNITRIALSDGNDWVSLVAEAK